MNKRVFLLIIILLIVVLFVSVKFYLDIKREVLNEYNHYLLIEKKLKEINKLKRKYKLNEYKINSLKKYCNIQENSDKYLIKCKNLDKNRFNYVQNLVFRSNFKIKNFDIEKNKTIFMRVEIIK